MAPKKWSDKNCCCKIVQKVTLKWRQKNGQTKKNCCCKIVQNVTLKWRQKNGQTKTVVVK